MTRRAARRRRARIPETNPPGMSSRSARLAETPSTGSRTRARPTRLRALSAAMKLDLVLFGRIRSGPFFALLRRPPPGRRRNDEDPLRGNRSDRARDDRRIGARHRGRGRAWQRWAMRCTCWPLGGDGLFPASAACDGQRCGRRWGVRTALDARRAVTRIARALQPTGGHRALLQFRRRRHRRWSAPSALSPCSRSMRR